MALVKKLVALQHNAQINIVVDSPSIYTYLSIRHMMLALSGSKERLVRSIMSACFSSLHHVYMRYRRLGHLCPAYACCYCMSRLCGTFLSSASHFIGTSASAEVPLFM